LLPTVTVTSFASRVTASICTGTVPVTVVCDVVVMFAVVAPEHVTSVNASRSLLATRWA